MARLAAVGGLVCGVGRQNYWGYYSQCWG
jgi:hypothetical protein